MTTTRKRTRKRRRLAAASLGACAVFSASAARAYDAAAEIRAIKAQMLAQQARLRQLESQVARQAQEAKEARAQAKHAANVANAASGKAGGKAPPPVFVTFKNGLFVATEDGGYSFRIGGRVHLASGASSQSLTGFDGQAGFRRVRLSVDGKAAKIWFYKLEYDLVGAANNLTIGGLRDAWLGLEHPALKLSFAKAPVFLQVGNFKEPFSLDGMNTATTFDFIDRPLPSDAFIPLRHIGVAASAYGDNWSAKGGLFTTSVEDHSLNPARGVPGTIGVLRYPNAAGANAWWQPTGGGQYFDLTGRVTYAPIKDEHRLLHFGLSGRYHRANDATGLSDDRVMRLGGRLRSEDNILGEGLLGTPDLSCGSVAVPFAAPATATAAGLLNVTTIAGKCVRDVETFSAEFAAAYGPLSVQAEYYGSRYNRDGSKLAQAAMAQAFAPNGAFLPAVAPFGAIGPFAPGGTSQYFDGYYAYVHWWITGEERASAYNVGSRNGAIFEQVKIKEPLSKGGLGAWGVGARFSAINLNNGLFQGSNLYNLLYLTTFVAPNPALRSYVANAGIVGGREQNLTVGANWYPDNGVHFAANWTRVMNLSAPFNLNPSQAYYSGAHPNLFQVSAQLWW